METSMKKVMLLVLVGLLVPLYVFGQSLQGTFKLVTFDVQIGRKQAQDFLGKHFTGTSSSLQHG